MARSFPALAFVLLTLAGCQSGPPRTATGDTPSAFTSDRITVVTRGNGPDLILVPGLSSHRAVWDSVSGPLEGRYRLHLIQVNGFAGLPAGGNADGPVSAPVAEEIARYITASGLTRPAVIGHSMGGSIAMMVAARHPDHVGPVMIVDMPAFMGQIFGGPGATGESIRPIADSMRARMLAKPDSFVQSFGQMVSGMTNRQALIPELLGYVNSSDPRTMANAFHELIVTDLRPELGRITGPMTVLYVVPPVSPVPPDQYEAGMRQSFANAPNARLVKVENAYHFIQLDQPARVVAEIEALVPPSPR
ncbi:MAG: alpha/beta fold hydrolase [Gemmatimonadales bacterium]